VSRKIDWKERNKDFALSGKDSPLSPHAVTPAINADAPVSCSTYGVFSEHILLWIDAQPILEESRVQTNKEMYGAIHNDLLPKREPRQAKELKKEKTKAVKARRAEFDRNRDRLMLAMLHSGKAYICNHQSCGEMRNLHVDHIIPLSKGGGDELTNLQFLCYKHNTEKGSKYPH
jgi:5-methylcytosine-specific restriction endonuclease McrA